MKGCAGSLARSRRRWRWPGCCETPSSRTTIVGATTTEELRADLDALTVQLDAEVAERLDRIWPGPGEAPQAYAW